MIDRDSLIDALDGVTWYNCLAEILLKWKEPGFLLNQGGSLCMDPDKVGYGYGAESERDNDQLQIIWMICIQLFGNFGTSPRYGWIEDADGFRDFLDAITALYRESEERNND